MPVCGIHARKSHKHPQLQAMNAKARAAVPTMKSDFPLGTTICHVKHKQLGVGKVIGYTATRVTIRWKGHCWHYLPIHIQRTNDPWTAKPIWCGAPGSSLGEGADVHAVFDEAMQRILLRRPDLLAAAREVVDVASVLKTAIDRKLCR